MFLVGYGTLRFVAEFFRTPDPGIFGTLSLGLSTAQWLCVPMVARRPAAARPREAARGGPVIRAQGRGVNIAHETSGRRTSHSPKRAIM